MVKINAAASNIDVMFFIISPYRVRLSLQGRGNIIVLVFDLKKERVHSAPKGKADFALFSTGTLLSGLYVIA